MSSADLPFSPAADRNRGAILDVLRVVLPERAVVLEIASGTGQHAAHFAAAEPNWTWQPSDVDADALPAIAARCAGLANVLVPLALDVLAQPWATTPVRFDAVYCANMLHIWPQATCAGLVRAAVDHLERDGRLVIYGPFFVAGESPAPSNLAFDASLRARDPTWGVRQLDELIATARTVGLEFEQRFDMPAHNLTLVFRPPAPRH